MSGVRGNLTQRKRHDIYWGTHGCERIKGHANPCRCNCGSRIVYDHRYVFGDDLGTEVRLPRE